MLPEAKHCDQPHQIEQCTIKTNRPVMEWSEPWRYIRIIIDEELTPPDHHLEFF